MPVDPQLQALVDMIRQAGMPKIGSIPVTQMRAMSSAPTAPTAQVWSVEDTSISGPAGEIPVRIYQPTRETAGLIVYCHGGGWCLGDLDSHDGMLRLLTNDTNCTIVSVDYRLAPEHPFPAAVDDAWASLQWADENRAKLTGDPQSPLIVMGDSAGANLAAVAAIMARDAGGPDIAQQVLVYPSTEGDIDAEGMRRFEPPLLDRETIAWFFDQYISTVQRGDFRFAPGRAPDLSNLPPAVIVTAEFDLLAEEGVLYGRKLTTAENDVTLLHYEGAIHGFLTINPLLDLSRKAILDVAETIQAVTSQAKAERKNAALS
jgi:acetyl esterase